MDTDKKFMLRAIELSKNSIEDGGGPFGCVIVKDGVIIAEGKNQVAIKNDPTAHAEIVTIREACTKIKNFNLQGFDIYTSCEPCPMCLSAIYWSRINKIFYGNTRKDAANIDFDDDFIYEELKIDISKRKIQMEQINDKEAKEIFDIWKNTKIKTRY